MIQLETDNYALGNVYNYDDHACLLVIVMLGSAAVYSLTDNSLYYYYLIVTSCGLTEAYHIKTMIYSK